MSHSVTANSLQPTHCVQHPCPLPSSPPSPQVEPLVKSYLGNSIHLLSSMTQPAMTAFTLRRLRSSAAFLGPFSHLTKKLMRIGLKLYGSEEAGPRLQV